MAQNQHKQRPDIKVGLRLNDKYADTLLPRMKELLRYKHQGFPGSQPVVFEPRHIEFLEKEDYFVRDKTDGKRCIMFFTGVDGGTAFMMDESCNFRILTGFKLPLRSNPGQIHNETMMDGEMVMEMNNNKKCIRYLIFDLMVLNGSILIEKSYSKRMGMLKHDVLEPLNAAMEKDVEMKKNVPFTMEIKSMELSYGLINVLQKIPSLKHGNDGLIFVPVNHPYEPGTCKKLLLWKPVTQLTVNFLIRAPRCSKPTYQLFISDDNDYKFYDYLTPDPDIAIQWQDNPPDGAVATFWYDKHWKTITHEGTSSSSDGGWRFVNFAHETCKADCNVEVERVWKSTQNAVSQDMLENRKRIVRDNWKRRQSIQLPGAQPLPSPTSQIQTPSINNVFDPQLFSNTQLVSPSVSTSEPFALLKERTSSEEQAQDKSNKSDLSESMEAITRSKFSQMLVTSPGKISPTGKLHLPYNVNDDDRSYFPPTYERKSPDQIRPSVDTGLQNMLQEKKSLDKETSMHPHIDATHIPSDNLPKNQLEKRLSDVQNLPLIKNSMETNEDIVHNKPFLKTLPKHDHDYSLSKRDDLLRDPEVIRRNDIIDHSSRLLEQSDDESNDELNVEPNDDESDDEREMEQVSSDDDLNHKELNSMSFSSIVGNNELSKNLSKQNYSYRQIRQKSGLNEEEYFTKDIGLWNQQEPHESAMLTKEREENNNNIQTFKQQKSLWKKRIIETQPIRQMQPSSQFSSQLQLSSNSQAIAKSSQEQLQKSQEMSFHTNQLKNQPKYLQLQPQTLIQENKYNSVQITPIQENNILSTSLSQQYQALDNQSNLTQIHVSNQKTISQSFLQSTNPFTSTQIQQTQESSTNTIVQDQYINQNINMQKEEFIAFKPITRRHTFSSISNPLYQSSSFNQKQFSKTVSSPEQKTLSSNISSISQPISSLRELNTYNLQSSFQDIQQQTNILKPISQKRKSKGALDFILNSSGESNQKRSKYDNDNIN